MPGYYNIIIGTYKTVKKLYLVGMYKYRVQWPRSAVSWVHSVVTGLVPKLSLQVRSSS